MSRNESHYSDMNYESAKFANANAWFLKINLMSCPATRSHTILYTRNEMIFQSTMLTVVKKDFECIIQTYINGN